MKPWTKCKAGVSSELPCNPMQPITGGASAMERADQEFYESFAQIAERALKGDYEEDILALQAIENTHCASQIAMSVLVKVLFLEEDVTSELFDCAKRNLSKEEYQSLKELLKGCTGLFMESETAPPSPGES